MDEQGWLERALLERRAVLSALRSGSGDVEVLLTWADMLDRLIRTGSVTGDYPGPDEVLSMDERVTLLATWCAGRNVREVVEVEDERAGAVGGYVLMRDEQVVGSFATWDDAMAHREQVMGADVDGWVIVTPGDVETTAPAGFTCSHCHETYPAPVTRVWTGDAYVCETCYHGAGWDGGEQFTGTAERVEYEVGENVRGYGPGSFLTFTKGDAWVAFNLDDESDRTDLVDYLNGELS